MSATGSSVINKSTKKIAPKAAVRRRPVEISASPQTSARESIERQSLPTPPATLTQPSPAPVTATQDTSREDATNSQATTTATQPATQSQVPSHASEQENDTPVASISPRQHVSPRQNAAGVPTIQPASGPGRASRSESIPSVLPSPAPGQPRVDQESQHTTEGLSAPQTTGPVAEKRKAPEPDRRSKRRRTEPPRDDGSALSEESQVASQVEDGRQAQVLPSSENATGQAASTAPASEQTTRPGRPRGREARQKTVKQGSKAASAAKKAKSAKTKGTAAKAKSGKTAATATTRKSRRRKQTSRESTPEDEEEDTLITPSEVKMADLCKDSGKGKKSNRERELAKLERANAERRRSAQEAEEAGEQDAQGEGGEPSTAPAPTPAPATAPPRAPPRARARAVPALRMVNGKMVVDDQSLQIDRHANAADEDEDVEEVEENDLTRRVTSGSWMKRSKKEAWGEELTDRFYQGLSMFGTDFMIISKLFPGRTRRQIKLKFTKEERLNPERIRHALVGPKEPMDLALLASHTNVEYGDPAEFQRELDQEAQEHAEEQKRQEEEAQEVLRIKRAKNAAAVAAASGAGKGGASGATVTEEQDAENRGGVKDKTAKGKNATASKPTKSKKTKKYGRFGGDEVEVVGTIDD